jgi:inhibitor of KinA
MSKLLQLNGESWRVSVLGEQALLLQPTLDDIPISTIHSAAGLLEKASIYGVVDIIPAYESIALIFDRILGDMEKEVETIESVIPAFSDAETSPQKIKIPVCYDLGLDWEIVEKQTGLSQNEIIEIHQKGHYTLAMMGFIPGFLYLSGLDKTIYCPRKEEPRTHIPAGSVGIGGEQTGVYSLESPGGWQIIGRTPCSFFDARLDPPSKVQLGDKVEFGRISEQEFSEWKES